MRKKGAYLLKPSITHDRLWLGDQLELDGDPDSGELGLSPAGYARPDSFSLISITFEH